VGSIDLEDHMRVSRIATPLLALALGVPATAQEQQPDAGAAAPAAAATDEVDDLRNRLHHLLLRRDVRRYARDHSIDLAPIHEGIDELGPAALAQVAPYADALDDADDQSTVTVSTTTIIIGLLVLILLVLIL
jgi:pyruvate/2-oxoglutarate dehydrogenase complex dihydrolipoamide acyltransferase (E2) component